ncbi:MAG: LytTR family DNA-binding domain-containing protein [Bacteroidales bacterium]|nr:LytTR family DNA-binding domain-containing protein [Bacteroidales bacterium]
MTIRCLIVDDEPLALDLIESYVRQTPFLELAGRCSNAIDALAAIEKGNIELVFLDIQMPKLNGIELSRLLKEETRIIFTTAFEQYALDGYKVDALDYLLKPISYPEFLKAATKAHKWFALYRANISEQANQNSIFVKSDYRMIQLDIPDITYIEGVKDYIRIHTSKGEPVMTLMSMKSIGEYLNPDTFIRVHRSFIVNINMISSIEKSVVKIGKTSVPISDSYKESVMEKINTRILTKQPTINKLHE